MFVFEGCTRWARPFCLANCGGPGEPSRWKSDEELVWQGLRPELVVEVTYDHVTGNRIRHGTKLLRWREDKAPRECGLEQLRD